MPLKTFFHHLLTSAAVLAAGLATSAHAQDVYLNGTVGGAIAPGVYGQITFGNQPPPPVLYAQPVIVYRGPPQGPPLYLYVPPGHAKNWSRHCAAYRACGRQVYFVQVNERNRWWDGHHGGPRPQPEHRREERREEHRDERRDDRRDDRQEQRHDERGGGHGHGNRDHGPRRFDDGRN